MLSRREFLIGMGGAVAAGAVSAKPVRGVVAAKGAVPSGGAGGVSARDYVQSGLAVLFDGRENVGWGESDTESIFWTDLMHTVPSYFSGALGTDYSWTESGFCKMHESRGTFNYDISGLLLDAFRSASFSVEAVTSSPVGTASWQAQIFNCCISEQVSSYSKGICGRYRREDNGQIAALGGTTYISGRSYAVADRKALNTCTLVYDSGNVWTYSDGVLVGAPQTVTKAEDLDSVVFRLGSSSYAFCGEYHGFRLYGRPLSVAEIVQNVTNDKARFYV